MSEITDFHSHVLPGVDDGSASLEESLAMLRMEAEQGIHRVIATPHFYPRHHSPERFLARRAAAEARLQDALAENGELPQVICGAEVYFFSGISECEALPQLTIGKKQCILIEMPHVPWSQSMYRELEEIQAKWGITPVIAHFDRYLDVLNVRGVLQILAGLPVLVQANADFFLNPFRRGGALRMLKRDQIHLLGSDCHNLTSRAPNLGKALQVIGKRLPADVLDRVGLYQEQVLADT